MKSKHTELPTVLPFEAQRVMLFAVFFRHVPKRMLGWWETADFIQD